MANELSNPILVDAEIYDTVGPNALVLTQPTSPAAEQFRVLRHRIELCAKEGHKALAFTSASTGEGKTMAAVNAAVELGRGGRHKVALVDGNLRHPEVHEALGLRANEGLCDVVLGRAALSSCLWRFGADGLWVLPAGRIPDEPHRVLYDPRMGQLFAELKRDFDIVLVDCPPALPLSDAVLVARELDGAILVVRACATPRELVREAIDALPGVTVRGLVLNDVDPHAPRRRLPLPTVELRQLPAHVAGAGAP